MPHSSTRLPLLLALTLIAPWWQSGFGATAPTHWVATWAAAPQTARIAFPRAPAPAPAAPAAAGAPSASGPPPAPRRAPGLGSPLHFDHQTVRMIVRVSLGGARVRVQLSNAFGTAPLPIGAAHIALSSGGSGIVAASDRTLSFSGQPSVVIPAGAAVLSDPVDLRVPALAHLAISLYVAGKIADITAHLAALHTTYISGMGDFTAAAALADAQMQQSWYWLSGVDVAAAPSAGLIVAFGDSITDGVNSTPNADLSWVGQLARRLEAAPTRGRNWALINEGISGNRLLNDFIGPAGLARLDRDVFSQPGVKWVIVLEGINDIGFSSLPGIPATAAVTAQQLIAAQRQIIERAHVRGLRVMGATLTPFQGASYYSEHGESVREAVNHWIRTSHAFDAVVDFDAVVRDPHHLKAIRADFNHTDHLHPNDAGYKAMADAIDTAIFGSSIVSAPSP
ncbi:MAG: SGNH/GDSL hydrolase family protein [Steroidobacteraceae bacterium]